MNTLYFGDNLDVMRDRLADASVDLIYLDPPFNSKSTYNILYKSPIGADAQRKAFEDTWHWEDGAQSAMEDVRRADVRIFKVLQALQGFLGQSDVMAYLAMMTVRLVEMRRILKRTGSLYLHCDPTASHYLKIVLDSIFGGANFRSELIWKRTSAHSSAKRWGDVHDVLLFYTASDEYTWNKIFTPYDDLYTKRYKRAMPDGTLWTDDNLTAPGTRNGDSGASWRGLNPTDKGNHWKISNAAVIDLAGSEEAKKMSTTAKLDLLDENGLIYWGKDGSYPRFKRVLGSGMPPQDIISDIPPINSQAQERIAKFTMSASRALVWYDSRAPWPQQLDGGSCAILKFGSEVFGVTAAHVVSAFENALARNPNFVSLIHDTPIDLLGNIIALNDELDLATFRLTEEQVKSSQGIALDCSDAWPPPGIEEGDGLTFSGFPELMKGKTGPKLEFRAFIGMLRTTFVSEKDIVAAWDPSIDKRPISNPAVPELGPNTSGCSGGVVLLQRIVKGLHRWFPVGIIVEGPSGGDIPIDLYKGRRLDFVRPDGSISNPVGSGWLPS